MTANPSIGTGWGDGQVAITHRTELLVDRLRTEVRGITDTQVRDLVQAWVLAWNEVAPDLNATLVELLTSGGEVSRAGLLRSERLRQVLLIIRDQLDTLAGDGRNRLVRDLDRVIDIAGGAQASVIDSQLPSAGRHLVDLQAWTRVDARSVEAIVKRTTGRITSRFKPLAAQADRVLRQELIRGYAAGTSPRATAARIVKRAEGNFNGGLARALAIARTETNDAARAGAHLGRMQHAEVLAGWSWHCELSQRTCPACIAMDGTVFPAEATGPDDHVNGRCTAVPVARSWAELGFPDLVEPPSVRVSGPDWFESQPPDVQRQILGPSRFQAWQNGGYPVETWGAMRVNDGWRDSLQVTRVPGVHSGGRAAS